MVKSFEHVEHRPVVLVEEPVRDVHTEVGIDPDEVLIVGAVVNGAQAEPVRHDGFAPLLEVSDDMRSVEQSDLLQSADRAAIGVRGEDEAAELRLMQALLDLAHPVAALDLVADTHRLSLVVRTAHPREGEEDAACCNVVRVHEGGVDRAIPVARACRRSKRLVRRERERAAATC